MMNRTTKNLRPGHDAIHQNGDVHENRNAELTRRRQNNKDFLEFPFPIRSTKSADWVWKTLHLESAAQHKTRGGKWTRGHAEETSHDNGVGTSYDSIYIMAILIDFMVRLRRWILDDVSFRSRKLRSLCVCGVESSSDAGVTNGVREHREIAMLFR